MVLEETSFADTFVMFVTIKTNQYITVLDVTKLNDVFGNTIGAMIGSRVTWMCLNWRKFRMDEQKTENKKTTEKKWWQKLLSFIKEKIWYLILLTISTGYLAVNRFAIEKLNDASMLSTVFIIWIILLVLPLFSELEFLGVKVKKEVKEAVEKSNEEVKTSLNNLQLLVSQIQISNSVGAQFTINNGPLPSEEKMDNLIKENHLPNEQITKRQIKKQDDIKIPEQNLNLFRFRYGIEARLNDALGLIEYTDKNHFSLIQAANYLKKQKFLDPNCAELLIQVVRIANRGVHGEIVNEKYFDFASEAYPKIIDGLDECIERIKKYPDYNVS